MTTPHTEQPAEGPSTPDEDVDPRDEPSNPDKTGASIDSRIDPEQHDQLE